MLLVKQFQKKNIYIHCYRGFYYFESARKGLTILILLPYQLQEIVRGLTVNLANSVVCVIQGQQEKEKRAFHCIGWELFNILASLPRIPLSASAFPYTVTR